MKLIYDLYRAYQLGHISLDIQALNPDHTQKVYKSTTSIKPVFEFKPHGIKRSNNAAQMKCSQYSINMNLYSILSFFLLFHFHLPLRCCMKNILGRNDFYFSAAFYRVPSPPKIKVDHNIQLDSLTINLANINIIFHSSTLYFVSQSLRL